MLSWSSLCSVMQRSVKVRATLEFGLHLGEGEPVVLELADRAAEGLAGLAVFEGLLEGRLRAGQSGDADGDALPRAGSASGG